MPYVMPLKGHQRTEHQKAQTAAMGKRQWLPKSCTKVRVIDPTSSRIFSQERKKLRKELEKAWRSEHSAQKWEQRIRKKFEKAEEDSQGWVEEVAEVVEERCDEQLEELREDKEHLKKDVARLNACDHQEPSKIQHAVQVALNQSKDSDVVQPTTLFVKDKRGIIQDWACNMIVTLVSEGIPMSKTWSVVCVSAKAMGVTIIGSWSSRSSCPVVREGAFAASLMIMRYVLTCISLLSSGQQPSVAHLLLLAFTMSGDRTSHKNIQYSLRHAVAILPDSKLPKDCFLRITLEVNHTTNTQSEGWKQTIQYLCDNYNKSPLGSVVHANPTLVWEKLRGYLSDHASGQKKLSAMLQRYQWECD